jgi:hypothetical protein
MILNYNGSVAKSVYQTFYFISDILLYPCTEVVEGLVFRNMGLCSCRFFILILIPTSFLFYTGHWMWKVSVHHLNLLARFILRQQVIFLVCQGYFFLYVDDLKVAWELYLMASLVVFPASFSSCGCLSNFLIPSFDLISSCLF